MTAELRATSSTKPGEVEAGVLAGEIGQRADLQPGQVEALGHLRERGALHGHRLGLELAVQPRRVASQWMN